MMIQVVTSGTGIAAPLPRPRSPARPAPPSSARRRASRSRARGGPEQDVDAWFTAFAPAEKPQLAVAAMVVNASGDGGTVAAPIVAQVLAAGLE